MNLHTHVAPIECDICICIVVNRALYDHKNQVTEN